LSSQSTQEAHGLIALIGQINQTVETIRETIAVSSVERGCLIDVVGEATADHICSFRQEVLSEFDRLLAGQGAAICAQAAKRRKEIVRQSRVEAVRMKKYQARWWKQHHPRAAMGAL
jgi:hypothetical protein